MTTINNKDAAILACLAQVKYHSLDMLMLIDDLSSDATKKLALKILNRDLADKEAKAWLDWGSSLGSKTLST